MDESSRGSGKQRFPITLLKNPKDLEFLLVLDFEATCEEQNSTFQNEIIEVPVVMVDLKTLIVKDVFHSYVRPTLNPILTNFCKELTGIQQEWVDNAKTLPDVMEDLRLWLIHRHLLDEHGNMLRNFAFATDGPWDFGKFLRTEYERLQLPIPFYFKKWVDVRQLFANFFYCRRMNVSRMLEKLDMEFVGRKHSGLEDAKNIARIVVALIQRGCPLQITGKL